MDNSSINYNRAFPSATRDSTQGKKDFGAGFRIKNPSQKRMPEQDQEEQDYERRREEELHRQIRIKDAEIHSLSKASEYLKSRIDQSMTNIHHPSQFQESKSSNSLQRAAPERDKSPYRGGVSPYRQESSDFQAPPHLREHLSNLQSDNASLMRRLNLVLQELDRVQREKDEIGERLEQFAKEAMNLQRMINGEDNLDKVNKYMQEDLSYERERNQKLKTSIREQEQHQNELINELRKIEGEQEFEAHQSQNVNQELQTRIQQVADIEGELYFSQEKLAQLSHAVEQGKLDEAADSQEKEDLQRLINELLFERNDLLSKLENLTRRYDDCVREISQDREEMENHNDQHGKLVAAKILFGELERTQKNKLKQGMAEIKIYCQFDTKCHEKLNKFSKVLLKAGLFTKGKALSKWFQVTLRPTDHRKHSERIVQQIANNRLKGKMYHVWRERYSGRIAQYDTKTKALEKMWEHFQRDAQFEVKRSFEIWKDLNKQRTKQKDKVKKLLWKCYFNKVSAAWGTWMNHSVTLDNQVRLNLLSKEFANKQLLRSLFHGFKYVSFDLQRRRKNQLFHYLKSWKDYIQYNKFLMASQVQALHFTQSLNHSLMKACFDAMKQSKESEKYFKTNMELNDIERPMLKELDQNMNQYQKERQTKSSKKAGEIFCKMAGKGIFPYFQKWRQIVQDFKEAPNAKMKGRIIKAYYDKIRMAFNRWKVILAQGAKMQCEMVMMEEQEFQKNLQDEVLSVKKEIKEKSNKMDESGKTKVNKLAQKFDRTLLKMAFGKWKFKIDDMNVKEGSTSGVVKRLRLRYLRQAFDLYRDGVKYKKKLEVEEKRVVQHINTRNRRTLAEILNQWRNYKEAFKRSKKYWFRIFNMYGKHLAQKAFKKWRGECGNQMVMEFSSEENKVVEQVAELNHKIGQLAAVEDKQSQEIKQVQGQMSKQARRIIANAFANFYYTGQTRGFEKWKEYTAFQKKREKLMRKVIDHWRKNQFYFVKAAFKNWILNSDIEERKEQVKKEEMRLADTQHQKAMQDNMYSSAKQQMNNEVEEVHRLQNMYNSRLQKSMMMIVGKVDSNFYMSQKRYILQQWRDYVKRQKFFIRATLNVITKSAWSTGFQAIREFSRDGHKHDRMSTVLNRFRLKFWKRNCGNAISVWKAGTFSIAFTTLEDTIQATNQSIEDHNAMVKKRREHNENKSGKTLVKQRVRNMFYGWKNVAQFLKFHNAKASQFGMNMETFKKTLAVRRWLARKRATHLARLRMKRLKEKMDRIRLIMVFKGLFGVIQTERDFMLRMSNLANIHDQQALKQGYNAIISFSRAKLYVQTRQKQVGSKSLSGILTNLVLRRKGLYLNELKRLSLTKYKEDRQKFYTILRSVGNKMRFYFEKWKESKNKDTLSIEMHNEGPIREKIFEERIDLKNLEKLMEQQGYSEQDRELAMKKGSKHQFHLLLKGVRRFQHFNLELYTKPKMFDRWRQFVHLRKLFRYWLGFATNRGDYGICDLAVAFDRWKHFDPHSKEVLKRLSKDQLDKRVLQNADTLGKLVDEIQDKENHLRHLNDQREELIEDYIKGQRLALSMMMNNQLRSKQRAFLTWSKNAKAMANEDHDDALRRNIDLIAALKEKIRQLEKENDDFSNENEELRQFSLDGYEIAKNVQSLSQEREKLSVDLADKAQTIKKLLDENEKLNTNLKMAQQEAQHLLKSTKKMNGEGQSPLMWSGGGVY